MNNTVLVEGHRGYSAKYPENTLISFAAAMDLGVDGVELDIRWSADKVLMVIHDPSLYRTCNVDVNINTLTLEQIKEGKITGTVMCDVESLTAKVADLALVLLSGAPEQKEYYVNHIVVTEDNVESYME